VKLVFSIIFSAISTHALASPFIARYINSPSSYLIPSSLNIGINRDLASLNIFKQDVANPNAILWSADKLCDNALSPSLDSLIFPDNRYKKSLNYLAFISNLSEKYIMYSSNSDKLLFKRQTTAFNVRVDLHIEFDGLRSL